MDYFVGLGLVAVVVLVVVHRRRRRARLRDAALAGRWHDVLEASRMDRVNVAFVLNSYQHARRGTKAVVQWLRDGSQQDAWIEGLWVATGSYLVLREGSTGYGPHNLNPHVFYCSHPLVLPGDAPEAWERHQRRQRAS